MDRDFYNISVCFEHKTFSDPMTTYRFCLPPQVGDEVIGTDYIYKVKKVIHSNGMGIEDPEVSVLLEFVRNVPM